MRIVTQRIIILSPEHAPLIISSPARQRFPQRLVMKSILRILRGNILCSMSTVTREKRAHINHAYFCYSKDLELYFLSDPSSLHCRNLLTNPSMAMTIFNSSQKWGGPDRGMQLFGTCSEAKGSRMAKAGHLYGKRFLAYGKWRTRQEKNNQLRRFRYRFYRFVPKQVKILDEREFGAGVFLIAAIKRST